MWNAIFTYGNFNFHARIINFTKNFNYTSHCLTIAVWIVNDFSTNNLTQFCVTLRFGRYQNVMANAFVFWRNNQYTIFIQQTTNYHLVGMNDHIHNLTFRPATPISTQYPYIYFVAMHDSRHFLFRKEDILTAVIRNDKSKSISVALNCS